MNNSEYKKIAPGMLKIQQTLGNYDIEKEAITDKKKLLSDALDHIGELMGINFQIPNENFGDDLDEMIERISVYSGIRIQKINLENHWWKDDLGIILGFMDEIPCVLTPQANGSYKRSTATTKQALSSAELAKLSNFGYTFTKPLPKISNLFDLLKFAFGSLFSELKSVVYVQLCISLIYMSLPILISYFFNHFADFVESSQLMILTTALIITAVIFFLLSAFQSILLLHLRYKAQIQLEPAIWDRLLKLTPGFYRQFNSGNIAYRASVISSIQEMLTQSSILSLFSLVTCIVSLGLMCFYDLKLGLLVFVSALIIIPVILYISRQFLIQERKVYDSLSKQSGFVFQVISGIMKFKVSSGEFRAFNLWSDYFANLITARYKANKTQIYMRMLQSLVLMGMTLVLFCIYIYFDTSLKFGSFIAFNAAFVQFFTALLTMATFASTLATVIPLFEQTLVIYQAEEEPVQQSGSHIHVEGKISIRNLSFRYYESQTLIYKNINLDIKPGEVIGITGTSGCGKSTLFRLLTGMEKPLDGQIFYDDVNLDMINLPSLRKQLGIVTQKSILTPGTILENIIGNNKQLTRVDAWDIVYKLGLEDMIKSFPMEMDTFINEGMQSLSGGEQQRIVLARALIKNPKILFLDEATSALDAQNQSNIQEYLAKMKITQLIIAHRLSTLKHADRVLVIHDGRIVQEGHFNELVQTEGYFKELAKFQFG